LVAVAAGFVGVAVAAAFVAVAAAFVGVAVAGVPVTAAFVAVAAAFVGVAVAAASLVHATDSNMEATNRIAKPKSPTTSNVLLLCMFTLLSIRLMNPFQSRTGPRYSPPPLGPSPL